METLEFVLGIVLLVMAVFLVIAVLMQSSKNHRLSGTIAGGAETFFGKAKGKTIDALLNKLTTVISILFVICVLAIYVIQPKVAIDENMLSDIDLSEINQQLPVDDTTVVDDATVEDGAETADVADETTEVAPENAEAAPETTEETPENAEVAPEVTEEAAN